MSDMAAVPVGQQPDSAAGGNKNKKGKKVRGSQTARPDGGETCFLCKLFGKRGRGAGWGGG